MPRDAFPHGGNSRTSPRGDLHNARIQRVVASHEPRLSYGVYRYQEVTRVMRQLTSAALHLPGPDLPPPLLRGKSILIVEDEPLIALGIHAALSATGASIIAATNGPEALRLIRSAEISAAVLDVNLGTRDCSEECQALARRRIPFLFYTGYVNAPVLQSWPLVPVVRKPAPATRLVAAVFDLLK
jgi:CheY-like chemotaxis protein